MYKYKIILLSLLITSTVISCKKNNGSSPDEKPEADIYLAGVVDKPDIAEATIWKNGLPTTLPSPSKIYSNISAIAVDGIDLYAAGAYFAGSGPYTSVACYWKNGTITALTTPSQSAVTSGMVVNKNDVYITGTINEHAVYWKNGNLIGLPEGNFNRSSATDIIINGSDVYICGSVSTNFTTQACYWKNGTLTSVLTLLDNSVASAIKFNGTDMYITGSLSVKNDVLGTFSGRACYWKNGNIVMLQDGDSKSSNASNIAFLNNDIYVVGNADQYDKQASAAYWKNGNLTRLTDGKEYSGGNKITFWDNDIYIVGTSKAGYATIWKNGVPTQLSQSGSTVRSIVIVKR